MLAAGIDVFSTVNVQHLESLNDQVAELTGVRVRETFPDEVLARRRRGRARRPHARGADRAAAAGKVYRAERVAGGAQRLLPDREPRALREVALRQVAEDVEAKRLVRRPSARARGPLSRRAAGGRRAAARARHAEPRSQRVVRRAWRSAQRLGAELDLLGRAARARAARRASASSSRRCAGSPRARRHAARRGGRRRRRRSSRASRASAARPTC